MGDVKLVAGLSAILSIALFILAITTLTQATKRDGGAPQDIPGVIAGALYIAMSIAAAVLTSKAIF
jgi:hypothetical protein